MIISSTFFLILTTKLHKKQFWKEGLVNHVTFIRKFKIESMARCGSCHRALPSFLWPQQPLRHFHYKGPSLKADISRSSWSFSDVSRALESCFQGAFIAPYVYSMNKTIFRNQAFQKKRVKTRTVIKYCGQLHRKDS